MAHWNHRVMRTESEGETTYGIHEVYYDDGGLSFWTLNPVSPSGETVEELQHELLRMLATCCAPVLDSETGNEVT